MFNTSTPKMKKKLFKLLILLLIFAVTLIFIFIFNSKNIKTSTEVPISPIQLHHRDYHITTNSATNEIQEAINKASSSGGGTITFESGYYNITKPIVLKSNVTLIGAGKNITVFKRDKNIDLGNNGILTTNINKSIYNVIIKDLTLDSQSSQNNKTKLEINNLASNYGMLINESIKVNNKILLENFKIKNSSNGLFVNNTQNLTINNSEFSGNGGLYKNWHNLYLNKVSKSSIHNSYMNYSTSGNGIEIIKSNNITIEDCHIYNNYFMGIHITDSLNFDIISCNIYNNKVSDGISIGSKSNYVYNFKLISNFLSSNGGYGINVKDKCHNGKINYNLYDENNNLGNLNVENKNISIKN